MKNTTEQQHLGSTLIEVIVAGTLLITTLGIVSRGVMGTQQLWAGDRDYQLALDELSNQLERLTMRDSATSDVDLELLEPSQLVMNRLPGATLSGEMISDRDGDRIALSIQWDRLANAVPVTLVGWVVANRNEIDDQLGAKR